MTEPSDRTGIDAIEVARLAALPTLAYEREREPAAEQLGCRVSILDHLVKTAQAAASPAADSGGRGRSLEIADIEPWPEPVDGAALLEELAQTICRYVVLDPAAADAEALWAVHTHAIEAAYLSPRLAITSPEKRCGKTTNLSLLGAFVARPLPTANMTTATMFRVIEAARPTLLVDEADTFLGGAEEMRGIINAGHCRASAAVLRTVETPDGYEVREFSVWAPMAIAAIGRLPGTIEDRAVKIAMRRRRPDETVERLRFDRLDRLRPLAQRAARWVADHAATLAAADSAVPGELHDRAADNWRPLLAIADTAGGDWPERARRAAVSLTGEGADDADTARAMLLADLRELFAGDPSGILFSRDILPALVKREDRPWPEYRHGKPITEHQLAALLKPLKISSKSVRRGPDTAKGYRAVDLADAWARYLPPLPADLSVTPSQPAESRGFCAAVSVTRRADVTDAKPPKAAESATCDGVTDAAPLGWRERV
jgi:putative DNA primase/helicase